MNLLILWSPLADYTLECFKELSRRKDINLFIVYQDVSSDAPFKAFDLSFFRWAKKYEAADEEQLKKACIGIKPDFILMASWNYSVYMDIAKQCRKQGTFVISAFDGQWGPTLKQRIGVLASPYFLKPAIDNFFVPGDRQAKFARKLGYENPLTGYYCANTNRFNSARREKVIRKFIFIGRLIEIKGVKELLEGYRAYRKKSVNPWELIVAGTGPLKPLLENEEGITLKGFVQPEDLPGVMSEATCLILPSHSEPWGLVVHEAVTAGLIVLASYKVGATTWFLRDGVNGRTLSNDAQSIENGLLQIAGSSDEKLLSMSHESQVLGALWTTKKWADYVYEYLNLNLRSDESNLQADETKQNQLTR